MGASIGRDNIEAYWERMCEQALKEREKYISNMWKDVLVVLFLLYSDSLIGFFLHAFSYLFLYF